MPALMPSVRNERVWIFDLDDTLHDARSHIFPHIHRAMTDYMHTHLGVAADEAGILRDRYWKQYGATLSGVLRHHDADPQHFLQTTHDMNILTPHITRSPGVRSMLARLPGRKFVFSNAPAHYSNAVLDALGIADLFDDVFTIEHASYRPKPDTHGFLKLLRKCRLRAENCIMIEDTLANLRTAKKLGMHTIWLVQHAGQSAKKPAFVDFNLRSLLQLPRITKHYWN